MENSDYIDLNKNRQVCEMYLSRILEESVILLSAKPLMKSTRDSPWRLDVQVGRKRRSFVLRLDARFGEHDYSILKAMESIPIPTPKAFGWDPDGKTFGITCFFYDYIDGESLLKPVLAGERWAEDLYVETVCALQNITKEQLFSIQDRLGMEVTARGTLEESHDYIIAHPNQLAETVYEKLIDAMPEFPVTRYSNGDLWLDNFLVRNRKLAGVIDFQHAGFSDPLFEFLLSFFVESQLRGRGIEERYCKRMGIDPNIIPWYHGLEYLDTWRWVVSTGQDFVHYNQQVLEEELRRWLVEEL